MKLLNCNKQDNKIQQKNLKKSSLYVNLFSYFHTVVADIDDTRSDLDSF